MPTAVMTESSENTMSMTAMVTITFAKLVALGAAALGGLFHFITKGPNEVSKELEDEMERKDQEALEKESQR